MTIACIKIFIQCHISNLVEFSQNLTYFLHFPERCPPLTLPLGSVECDGDTVGSTCNFKCSEVASLIGSSRSTCIENVEGDATWTNLLPVCESKSMFFRIVVEQIQSLPVIYTTLPRLMVPVNLNVVVSRLKSTMCFYRELLP